MAKRNHRIRKTTRGSNISNRRHLIFVVIKLENACREQAVPPEKVDGYFRQVYKQIKDHVPRETVTALIRCIVEVLKQYL